MATTAPPLPRRRSSGGRVPPISIGLVAGLLSLFLYGLWLGWFNQGDGIEENVTFPIVYSQRVWAVEADNPKAKPELARVYLFKDRNRPKESLVVLENDMRGVLIRINRSLPESSFRKIREKVAARVIEGERRPAAEYVVYEHHFSKMEFQSGPYPTVILKKD